MDIDQMIVDQAQHIANVAQAIADGRIAGQGEVGNPRRAAVLGMRENVGTLLAWIERADAPRTLLELHEAGEL
jgi:hypothetical protein